LDIRNKLKEFIIDNFMMGREDEELTDSGSLLELGIIDSTGVLELVSFLEGEFEFTIDDEELIPENLDSVEHLIKFIERKKQ